MLDEIVRLLQQIKSVGDNIAHDLRSPLAVMRTKLERDLAADSGQELRAAAEGALGDLGQALATVTALLRNEIESGRRRSGFTRVDLAQVCANVFELYEPLAEAKPVRLRWTHRRRFRSAAISNCWSKRLRTSSIMRSNSHREAARREDEWGSASRPRDTQRPKERKEIGLAVKASLSANMRSRRDSRQL
jgi:signal transduction histidine kinase